MLDKRGERTIVQVVCYFTDEPLKRIWMTLQAEGYTSDGIPILPGISEPPSAVLSFSPTTSTRSTPDQATA